jgi:hypothetical protein
LLSDFRPTAPLPQAEALIAEAIGRGPAIALSHRVLHANPFQHGRNSVRGALYVPKMPTPRFVRLVGNSEHASALCAVAPGEQLMLTGCRTALKQLQHYLVRRLYRQGVSAAELARLTSITRGQIRRIVIGDVMEVDMTADITIWKRALWAYSLMLRARPL